MKIKSLEELELGVQIEISLDINGNLVSNGSLETMEKRTGSLTSWEVVGTFEEGMVVTVKLNKDDKEEEYKSKLFHHGNEIHGELYVGVP